MDQVQVKSESRSPEQQREVGDKNLDDNMDSVAPTPFISSPPAEEGSPTPIPLRYRLVPESERRSPSIEVSSDPDRSFSESDDQRTPPQFPLSPPNIGLQLAETPANDGTPAVFPPETPARLVEASPYPFLAVAPTPRPSSRMMRELQENQGPVKTEESPAETLRASDNTPTGSESSTSTQSEVGYSTSTTVPQHYQPVATPIVSSSGGPSVAGPSTRRTTRGSVAAATASGSTDIVKRATPEPGGPIQASVNCWIITNVKDWILPPPAIGVSLAQVVPPDVTTQPWMKFTRHPILWDQKTDAGGKSGKKLVTIGAAAAKASVNGKLLGAQREKPETFDGLHLLMDFHPDIKPSYSYALITRFAILGSPYKSLSLGEIYMMLEAKFPWFAKDESKWRDSIRYNLSSNNWFVKTKRALHQPGIGNLWKVDEESPGGPKRPRKGRNRGSAFTDPDDDDEGSQDEYAEPSTQRNGTLMYTFDSKQKLPLGKNTGHRKSTSSQSSRPSNRQADDATKKPEAEEVSLSTVDPYAEARNSKFLGAAKAAIEKTRETAAKQKSAPKDTPAPPWMGSRNFDEEVDSGIGSGKDDESGGSGQGEEEGGGADEPSHGEDHMHVVPGDDVVQMEEDTPSPPSPNSASSSPTQHQAHNPAMARHIAPPARVPTPPRTQLDTTRATTIRRRPSATFPEHAKVVDVPTMASVWIRGSNNSTSVEQSPAPSQASTSQPRPTRTIPSSSAFTTASTDSNVMVPPDPQIWGKPLFPSQNQRRPVSIYKPIAPTASSGGPGVRATIASTTITPYVPSMDSRKRKNMQTSPGRGGLSVEERQKKLRKIESSSTNKAKGMEALFSVSKPSLNGPGSSTQTARGSFSTGMPPPSSAAVSASKAKRPSGIAGPSSVLSAPMRSAFPMGTSSAGFGATISRSSILDSATGGHNVFPRQDASSSGPSPFRPAGAQRSSITFESLGISDPSMRNQRNSNATQPRSRRASGNMDIDRYDGNDSDSYERSPPTSRMELDGSEDESWRGRSLSSHRIGPSRSSSVQRVVGAGNSMFAQAVSRPAGSLSVTVPVSSSRTERGPPTPHEGMAISPSSASQSPTLANLVSPIGPPTQSPRLPPITSLLNQDLPSEPRGHLAPMQNMPSRNSPTLSSVRLIPANSTPPDTTISRRNSSITELSNPSPRSSRPSTFGPPLYYGFIASDTPPIPASSRSVPAYQGGDGDDIAFPRYSTRDWRD